MCAAPKGNKFAEGCETSGRPLKYKTVEELEEAIEKYFDSCVRLVIVRDKDGNVCLDDNGNPEKEWKMVKPMTVTGLAIAVGMTRQMLIEYAAKDEFGDTITHAKQKCQEFAEEQLYLAKSANGAIFSLKNNWNWKDKTEQEVTVSSNIAERLQRAKERKELAMQTINVDE